MHFHLDTTSRSDPWVPIWFQSIAHHACIPLIRNAWVTQLGAKYSGQNATPTSRIGGLSTSIPQIGLDPSQLARSGLCPSTETRMLIFPTRKPNNWATDLSHIESNLKKGTLALRHRPKQNRPRFSLQTSRFPARFAGAAQELRNGLLVANWGARGTAR